MDKFYHETAVILENVLNKKTTVKSAVYNSYIRNKRKLMKLCCETLKYRNYLNKFLEDKEISQILKTEGINGSKPLAWVVLYELIFGRGIVFFNGKLKKSAKSINHFIKDKKIELEQKGITSDSVAEVALSSSIPRYARINTLLDTSENIIEILKNDGWNIISNINVKEFNEKIKEMDEYDVIIDPHIENLLVFQPNYNLSQYILVKNRKLILQDKASCLPAYVLNPKSNSDVLDACAAPGNKSSHLAAIMGNKGKIYACDLSKQRVATMKELMKKAGVTNVKVSEGDFLMVDTTEKAFEQVKYIVVDPPCSGSGMIKRSDFMSEERNFDYKRLEKLHNLQVMLLRHAFKFPQVEKIVYSTCSVHENENEDVIVEILNDNEIYQNFELIDPLPSWKHRGNDGYDFYKKVLRADPEKDFTNGFFVALFQRKKHSAAR